MAPVVLGLAGKSASEAAHKATFTRERKERDTEKEEAMSNPRTVLDG